MTVVLVAAISTAAAQTQTPEAGAASTSRSEARAVSGPNVYAAGSQVRPGADVEGDFVAVGGRVIVDRPVKGDVNIAGGAVDVRAAVGDDLRAAGGDVTIDAEVRGEVFASGGNVHVDRNARIVHAAHLYGGKVSIDGRVDGPLRVGAQTIVINGEVGGDARLVGERIELGPTAKLAGALRWASPNELKRADAAVVGGAVTREADPEWARDRMPMHERGHGWGMRGWGMPGGGWFAAGVLGFFSMLASGALLLLAVPRFAAQAAGHVGATPLQAFGLGVAAVVGVPLLAVLLFITVLGIPLGLAMLALYPLMLLIGYLVGVLFIGQRARAALRPQADASSYAMTLGFFALALLLVTLLGSLPFIGGLLLAVIAVLGLGAGVIELQRRRAARTAAALPAPPAMTPGSTT